MPSIMAETLLGVSLVDLLESDPRPSFIVDLAPVPEPELDPVLSSPTPTPSPAVVFNSPAFAAHPALLGFLCSTESDTHALFWHWIRAGQSVPSSAHEYLGFYWTLTVVSKRWVVVSANELPAVPEPPRQPRPNAPRDPLRTQSDIPVRSGSGSRDREEQPPRLVRSATDTGLVLPDFMPEQLPFYDAVASVDWAATPLGPMDDWPERLHQTVSQVIADTRPIAIYWGPEMITIYNEAFGKLCGSKHPWLLGKPVKEAWPYAAEKLLSTIQLVIKKQRASGDQESRFFIESSDGPPQETYLKWSIVPILHNNECLGVMHPVLETTGARLWERRMKMLIELGERLVTARDTKAYWAKTIEELGSCEPAYDIPLAILYSVDDDLEDGHMPSPYDCGKVCRLEGALGVPTGHAIMPETLRLRHSEEGLSSTFREALKTPQPIVIHVRDGTLPKNLLTGLQWRGFGDPCRAAVVLPIRPTREENVMGMMILGLNPRRPYDNDYRQYISLLAQKLTTSLASTVLLEEEARRGRNAAEQAAYDQAMLKEKLAMQISAATESEQRFKAVAEFIPVGMCFGDDRGNITFANDAWHRITGLPLGPVPEGGFETCVVEEDRERLAKAYADLQQARYVTFEFRVKRRNNVPEYKAAPGFEEPALAELGVQDPAERHVLAMAKAEKTADGSVVRILTCLTDVTAHKKTADEAVRRAQQAENLKRMAEFATVGMYDMDLDGRLLGANRIFFEMFGLGPVDPTQTTVRPLETCVADEDKPLLQRSLSLLVEERRSQTAEIRLKTPLVVEEDDGGNKVYAPRWVVATFLPVLGRDGQVKSFTGCISDVSLQKRQVEQERRRKEEAIESKRQQENFIDMTSHEMRNPLSAIIHCADAIIASLGKLQEEDEEEEEEGKGEKRSGDGQALTLENPATTAKVKPPPSSRRRAVMSDTIDNAETIVTCAQHQKRIVDDILTMSKLDSKLLVVTPCTVDPVVIVQEALKMFEVEARRVDIALRMEVDASLGELGHRFLDFDPSRVKQVLINLLTNALKFTKAGPMREVTVCIRGSKSRPTAGKSSVQFIPRTEQLAVKEGNRAGNSGQYHHHNHQLSPDSKMEREREQEREAVYLLFEVHDTGRGLSEEEKRTLFGKFVQASSRTHVKYGGSGLGLFISRRLTELQNGAIGVSSLPGVGSTFAFFIEAYVPSEESLREAEKAAAAMTARNVSPASTLGPVPAVAAGSNGVKAAPPTPTLPAKMKKKQVDVAEEVGGLDPETATDAPIAGVLVVEDNLINQKITRRGLEDRGFRVAVANHGLEALEQLMRNAAGNPAGKQADSGLFASSSYGGTGSNGSSSGGSGETTIPINLVLMDVEMPVQDGLTCTRRIRELERQGWAFRAAGGRMPIIAVSANARPEQVLEALAAGCDDVLIKPYRMFELIDKMRVVVRRMDGDGSGLEKP